MNGNRFQNFPKRIKLLLIIEFGLLFTAFYLSAYNSLGFFGEGILKSQDTITTAFSTILFCFITQASLLSLGLYNPKFRESPSALLKRTILSILIGAGATYLFTPIQPAVILEATLYSIATISLLRYAIYRYDWLGKVKTRVLVIGAGERAAIIEKRMRRSVDRQGFQLCGFVPMPGDSQVNGITKETLIELDISKILDFVRDSQIQQIVVACDDRRNTLPVDDLFNCKLSGIEVIDILDFIERETGQLAVNLMYPSWIIYSNGFTSVNSLKSGFDNPLNMITALALTLVTWPIMLLTAIAIKIEDGLSAPVIYRQQRVGKNGNLFNIYKFRSMKTDAEKNGAVWAAKKDNRVTRVGEFIRKYRIDELPQLYNILKGDMDFVGPRPERPEFIKNLAVEIPYYNQRHNVKPGITGWAQLKYPYGASFEDSLEKLKYDLYYVKHRSFSLDLSIIFQTVEIIVFGKGR